MPTLSPTTIVLFGVLVVFFLWLDLHRRRGDEGVRVGSAVTWSLVWMGLALVFAGYIGIRFGGEWAWLFLSGYLLEQSLSVDNLFVFIAIFSSFAIRGSHQHRVLHYGIIGAVVLRLIFVAAGTSVLLAGRMNPNLHTAIYTAFGVAVLWSAHHMYRAMGRGDRDLEDYSHHWSVRWTRRFLPVHPQLEGERFFVRRDMRWRATPLFLCLVTVEASDVAFAFDSVPAVIAVTREPVLVYTSNIFAILGLRSLFFVLSAARNHLRHLEKAVVAILVFVGVKLLLEAFEPRLAAWCGCHLEISAGASLMVVLGILLLGIVCSLVLPPPARSMPAANADEPR